MAVYTFTEWLMSWLLFLFNASFRWEKELLRIRGLCKSSHSHQIFYQVLEAVMFLKNIVT